MKKIILTVSFIAVSAMISGCTTTSLPSSIEVNAPKLHPEGITYHDKSKRFFLSSIYEGKIISVNHEGVIKEFAKDESLVSTIGMHVDKKNNRLVVCNSDSGFGVKSTKETTGRLAQVLMYDLSTGDKLQTVDLASLYQGGHFANDLTFDEVGNIYVTDSFSPVIYKIDTKGVPSILLENELFRAPQGSFGLNGIVYHDNFLIVARADVGKLYKVPLDNPNNIKEIVLDGVVNSVDGLLLQKDKSLILVSNNFSAAPFDEAVYKIQTTDNWNSGSIKAVRKIKGNVFPTTVTEVGDSVFVNYSYLPDLVMKKPDVAQFKIQRIEF